MLWPGLSSWLLLLLLLLLLLMLLQVQSIRFMATPYFWLLVDGCWLLDLLAGPAYGATSQRLIASTVWARSDYYILPVQPTRDAFHY